MFLWTVSAWTVPESVNVSWQFTLRRSFLTPKHDIPLKIVIVALSSPSMILTLLVTFLLFYLAGRKNITLGQVGPAESRSVLAVQYSFATDPKSSSNHMFGQYEYLKPTVGLGMRSLNSWAILRQGQNRILTEGRDIQVATTSKGLTVIRLARCLLVGSHDANAAVIG